MKYRVVVSGSPYTIVADRMDRDDGRLSFFDEVDCGDIDPDYKPVAEFNLSKVDGIIWEDNNLED
jgi:hypothetical protein